MVAKATTDERAAAATQHLEQRIRAHLDRRNRRRTEHGDPAEAMGRFLIERFGLEALQESYEEYRRHPYSFVYGDDKDGDGDGDAVEHRDVDGRAPG
jgi:hypothetical protein